MNPKLKKMAALLLNEAADVFANHSCTDLTFEFIQQIELTDEEKIEIVTEMYTRNGDLDERLEGGPIEAKNFNHLPDWWLMRHLADKLEEPDEIVL